MPWIILAICSPILPLMDGERSSATRMRLVGKILNPKDYDRWLDREGQRPPTDLLRPYDAAKMIANPCNPKVGNVKNNGPEMLNSA